MFSFKNWIIVDMLYELSVIVIVHFLEYKDRKSVV